MAILEKNVLGRSRPCDPLMWDQVWDTGVESGTLWLEMNESRREHWEVKPERQWGLGRPGMVRLWLSSETDRSYQNI